MGLLWSLNKDDEQKDEKEGDETKVSFRTPFFRLGRARCLASPPQRRPSKLLKPLRQSEVRKLIGTH